MRVEANQIKVFHFARCKNTEEKWRIESWEWKIENRIEVENGKWTLQQAIRLASLNK
jgi:hypothetical protein